MFDRFPKERDECKEEQNLLMLKYVFSVTQISVDCGSQKHHLRLTKVYGLVVIILHFAPVKQSTCTTEFTQTIPRSNAFS